MVVYVIPMNGALVTLMIYNVVGKALEIVSLVIKYLLIVMIVKQGPVVNARTNLNGVIL